MPWLNEAQHEQDMRNHRVLSRDGRVPFTGVVPPTDAEVKQALAERGIDVTKATDISAQKPNEKGSDNACIRLRDRTSR